jgi:hypothetical protein
VVSELRRTNVVEVMVMTEERSRVQQVVAPKEVVVQSSEALFLANYDEMRRTGCKDVAGVGLVAVDTRSGVVVGTTWIGRDAERPNALIVGRHSMCDLVVSDPEVSLRHIAVLSPAGDARLAEFSPHDLHTAQGFTLEEGESVLAAAVFRFGVVRFGLYSLFCFATGLEAWSESAADVWVELGGETKTVHHEPKSGRAKERPKPDDRWQVGSLVSVIQGPLRTSDALVGPDE